MDNKSLSFKGKENYINNRKLSANTSNGKQSLISIDSQHNLSTVGLRSFDNQFLKYIQFKVKQYELHPFRRPNLKIINEDVKYKLFEMNKKTTFENKALPLVKSQCKQYKKKSPWISATS